MQCYVLAYIYVLQCRIVRGAVTGLGKDADSVTKSMNPEKEGTHLNDLGIMEVPFAMISRRRVKRRCLKQQLRHTHSLGDLFLWEL